MADRRPAKFQESRDPGAIAAAVSRLAPAGEGREQGTLNTRLADSIADDESDERSSPRSMATPQTRPDHDDDGALLSSNVDGVVEGRLTLPDTVAQRLLPSSARRTAR